MSFGWTTTRSTPELGAADLLLDGDQALADLRGRGVHRRDGLAAGHLQPHPGGRVVVEALGEADVLVGDRVADAADDALAVGRVVHRARQRPQVRAPRRARAAAAARETICSSSPTGAAESMTWPVMFRSPSRMPLRCRISTRSTPDRVGELVHQRLVRERRLHAAEPAHRPARRVVGEDAVARRRPPTGTGRGPDRGCRRCRRRRWSSDAYAPPSSRTRAFA